MTLGEVRAAVEEIRRAVGDDEKAHCLEDRLYRTVLQEIAVKGAMSANHMRKLAAEAIAVGEVEFERWCA